MKVKIELEETHLRRIISWGIDSIEDMEEIKKKSTSKIVHEAYDKHISRDREIIKILEKELHQ